MLTNSKNYNNDNYSNNIKNFLNLSTPQILVIGFLALIFLGAILLNLDIALKDGANIKFIDALFIATSSLCVTGLSTIGISSTFNVFGQLIILTLIQIGAIGFMAIVCLGVQILNKKMNLRSRKIFEESFDLDEDILNTIKKIVMFVIFIELTGAALLSFSFIPTFGLRKGIYYSIFHSISAFCNAGFDLFGNTSLVIFQTDWYINIIIMFLIITGGIGYIVIFDVIKVLRKTISNKYSFKTFFRKLNLHSKIVITTTIFLILFGMTSIFICESFNVNTFKNMPLDDKILISLFQSVTARTAGFNTIDMSLCNDSTNLIYIILMFIGGSPISTAGGIKTITIAILVLTVLAMINKNSKTVAFNRQISNENLRKCMVIFFLAVSLVVFSALVLISAENCTFLEGIFESVSAFATVGSSLGITSSLTMYSKFLLIVLMFTGRVGIITILMSLSYDDYRINNKIEYPEEKIILG